MPSRPALPPDVAAGLARLFATVRRHDEKVAAGTCDCPACKLARAAGHSPRPMKTAPATPLRARRRSAAAAGSVRPTVQNAIATAHDGPAPLGRSLDEVNAMLATAARSVRSRVQRLRYGPRF